MAAKLWATRLAAEGVQVFEVRPGIMATDMTAGVKEKYDRLIADGLVPQGRWGTAEDVGLRGRRPAEGLLPLLDRRRHQRRRRHAPAEALSVLKSDAVPRRAGAGAGDPAAVRAVGGEDRPAGEALEPRARARRSSPCAATTPAAAGPSGRRASSSAPPSCSSTPPARRGSWRSAATATVDRMASHLTHVGVHDHGFNNVSTYGNLLRLMREGRIPDDAWERALLRAGAEGQRRRAGRALDAARRPSSATSTRSTARTRCSPTPSARCARWPWPTSSATC